MLFLGNFRKNLLLKFSRIRVKEYFELTEVFFGLEDWKVSDRKEYRVGSEPKTTATGLGMISDVILWDSP